MMNLRMLFIVMLLAVSLGSSLSPRPLSAHTIQDEALPDIGVDEKLGAQLPLDLTFTDQKGKEVRLKDYFTGRPVILTLNYYSCPTLCPLIFRNLSHTISSIKGLSPAKDYPIVTVSIDPDETVERALALACGIAFLSACYLSLVRMKRSDIAFSASILYLMLLFAAIVADICFIQGQLS